MRALFTGTGGLGMRERLKGARAGAGMTQQAVADRLGVGLRYYQKIEAGTSTGDVALWDELEDMFGVHQRKLREIPGNRLGREASP